MEMILVDLKMFTKAILSAICWIMKQIQLTQGRIAFVDDQDFEWLDQYKWRAAWNGWHWYALAFGGVKTCSMHRLIMAAKRRQIVDHINGETLDNRRINLRFVTPSQNNMNRSYTKRNVAKAKGIRWELDRQRWLARIGINGRTINLGRFIHKKDAVKAYAKAAAQHFGEFAPP